MGCGNRQRIAQRHVCSADHDHNEVVDGLQVGHGLGGGSLHIRLSDRIGSGGGRGEEEEGDEREEEAGQHRGDESTREGRDGWVQMGREVSGL